MSSEADKDEQERNARYAKMMRCLEDIGYYGAQFMRELNARTPEYRAQEIKKMDTSERTKQQASEVNTD